MSILPQGSFINIGGNVLFISDIKKSFVTESFDRMEFDHNRLRTAPNKIGQHALLSRLLGDTPVQIVIGSVSFQQIVPLNPDVTVSGSNFGNIKKKFNITRYEITGAPSAADSVSNALALASDHLQRLANFQAHQMKAANMDTQHNELLSLQNETFSYLTTTGLSVIGNTLEGQQDNMLITSFSIPIDYDIPLNPSGSSYQLYKSFSVVLEQRTIDSLDQVSGVFTYDTP